MGQVLAAVVLLGLVASFSPVIVATSATLLTRPDPVRRGAAFVGGVALACGLVEVLTFALLLGVQDLAGVARRPAIAGAVNVALGAALLWLVVRLRRAPGGDPLPESAAPETRGDRALFVLGFTLMIANVRAVAAIAAATNEVFVARVTAVATLTVLALLLVVVVLLPASPILTHLVSPATAGRLPAAGKRLAARLHGVLAPVRRAASSVWVRARPATLLATALLGVWLVARGLALLADRPG